MLMLFPVKLLKIYGVWSSLGNPHEKLGSIMNPDALRRKQKIVEKYLLFVLWILIAFII